MSVKKLLVGSLIAGVVAFHIAIINGSLDYKLFHLRRKVNCLNRKLNKALRCMNEENLKKYEQELKDGYEKIKEKVENLTIREIKEKGNELIDSIYQNIIDFKRKIITYTK